MRYDHIGEIGMRIAADGLWEVVPRRALHGPAAAISLPKSPQVTKRIVLRRG